MEFLWQSTKETIFDDSSFSSFSFHFLFPFSLSSTAELTYDFSVMLAFLPIGVAVLLGCILLPKKKYNLFFLITMIVNLVLHSSLSRAALTLMDCVSDSGCGVSNNPVTAQTYYGRLRHDRTETCYGTYVDIHNGGGPLNKDDIAWFEREHPWANPVQSGPSSVVTCLARERQAVTGAIPEEYAAVCTKSTLGGVYFIPNVRHQVHIYLVAVPMLLVYSIGTPAFYFISLWRNRHKLSSIEIRSKYSYLIAGFRAERFYWEIFSIIKRMAYTWCATAVSGDLNGNKRSSWAMCLVILAATLAHVYGKPHEHKVLNHVELFSLVTALSVAIIFAMPQRAGDVASCLSQGLLCGNSLEELIACVCLCIYHFYSRLECFVFSSWILYSL